MLPLTAEFKENLLKGGYALGSVNQTLRVIEYFAAYMKDTDMKRVSKSDIDKYKKYIMLDHRRKDGKSLSNCTVIQRLAGLKKYFKFLCSKRYVFFDPTINLAIPKNIRKLPAYIPSEKELADFLQRPDIKTALGIRDRAILELLYNCPLRAEELRILELQDLDLTDKFIYPKRVKEGRECGIPIIRSAYTYLVKYLNRVRPKFLKRGDRNTDKVFLTERGDSFSPGTLRQIFYRYQTTRPTIHPHTMRHACAVHMLKNGAKTRDIQILLGHKSLRSTQIYTRLTANDLKEVHAKFHPRERQEAKKAVTICSVH